MKHFTETVTPERAQFDHRIRWDTKTSALFKGRVRVYEEEQCCLRVKA